MNGEPKGDSIGFNVRCTRDRRRAERTQQAPDCPSGGARSHLNSWYIVCRGVNTETDDTLAHKQCHWLKDRNDKIAAIGFLVFAEVPHHLQTAGQTVSILGDLGGCFHNLSPGEVAMK